MTHESTVESEMHFDTGNNGDCFNLEKSQFYKNRQESNRVVDFVFLKKEPSNQPILEFIEAKTTPPALSPGSEPTHKDISKICKKFHDSVLLTLIASTCCPQQIDDKNVPNPYLPASFRSLNWCDANFCFVLVVKDLDDKEVAQLDATIRNEFLDQYPSTMSSLGGRKKVRIEVYNEGFAQEKGYLCR